ncbi:NYN domain-containing protein [Aliiroseovarius sp. S1123]|uniref:NYN domain-containing protein n=1 Tax=Aliiroseovarius sp. S1123 TaxID=2926404 RepID=UPI001FF1C159|nr:NYN domain-containing protein [Aliiroseovarius sp. S1123]
MTNSGTPVLNTALLIDGENISSTWAGKTITASGQLGGLLVKRAYGNATKIKGWDEAPGIKLVHTGAGKNAADIALAIEAVELSYAGLVQNYVLVSSDGDFSHLATFLRERGHRVLGMGEDKAPLAFRKSCTDWQTLEARPQDLHRRILEEIRKRKDGILIGQVSPFLRGSLGVTLSDLDEKSWRKYFTNREDLFCVSGEAQQTRITAR